MLEFKFSPVFFFFLTLFRIKTLEHPLFQHAYNFCVSLSIILSLFLNVDFSTSSTSPSCRLHFSPFSFCPLVFASPAPTPSLSFNPFFLKWQQLLRCFWCSTSQELETPGCPALGHGSGCLLGAALFGLGCRTVLGEGIFPRGVFFCLWQADVLRASLAIVTKQRIY